MRVFAEARIFDKGALEKATQELKRQYVGARQVWCDDNDQSDRTGA